MTNNATQQSKSSDPDLINDQMSSIKITTSPSSKSKYVPPHQRSAPTKSRPAQNTAAAPSGNWQPQPFNPIATLQSENSRRYIPGADQSFHHHSSSHRSRDDDALKQELFGGSKINSGINFDKYDDIPVSASGNNVPAAVESFEEGGFHPLLQDVFRLSNYSKPTPIQKHAFSIVQAGRDLMACAQTGSGKTGAFLIPIISRMLSSNQQGQRPAFSNRGIRQVKPKALILAPTRELVQQIYDEARKFAFRSFIRPAVIYGGESIVGQLRQLDRGCDLLVATPGRLVDMIDRGKLSLEEVEFLVLDEADRMLDMGFEVQIRKIVLDSGMRNPGEGRNTLMFSATFPKDIQSLAREFLNDYIFVTVGKVGASSENIKQHIEYLREDEKQSFLLDLLQEDMKANGLVLVFVETKRNADILDRFIYDNGFCSCSIHGDKSQAERTEALHLFRSGTAPILVATSVASRGLDIPNVLHVINYELPGDMDDYVHRIGRTGRAGNLGKATTFFTDKNRGSARDLVKILEDAKQEIPSWLVSMANTSSASSLTSRYGSGRGGYRQSSSSSSTFSRYSSSTNRTPGNADYRPQTFGTKFVSSWE